MRKPDLIRRLISIVSALLVLGTFALPALAAQKATLIAKVVAQLPEDPNDPAWEDADVLAVPLAPQAVVKPRAYEVGVTALEVRALYASERLAFRLQWQDPQRDGMAGQVAAFRDAVAVEFPALPAAGIPYFAMGEPDRPVTLYQWKADFQSAPAADVDERYPLMIADWYPFSGRGPGEIAEAADYGSPAGDRTFITAWAAGNALADQELQQRTAVEKLAAKGFGSVTSVPPQDQDGAARAIWQDGVWTVVISVPREQEEFLFERGMTVPVAFAAWDGAHRERGGEKGVSTWYFLSLEQPVDPLRAYGAPLAVFAGVGLLQFAGLRRWRRTPGAATPG
ncbi:MAG: hypothetical protein IT495_16200 [Gammaproteobacteria bacterium]|nr:hypothetical protein [Gammaproteobacteria bacterium]